MLPARILLMLPMAQFQASLLRWLSLRPRSKMDASRVGAWAVHSGPEHSWCVPRCKHVAAWVQVSHPSPPLAGAQAFKDICTQITVWVSPICAHTQNGSHLSVSCLYPIASSRFQSAPNCRCTQIHKFCKMGQSFCKLLDAYVMIFDPQCFDC